MRFRVRRASDGNEEHRPCEEAQPGQYTRTDTVLTATAAKRPTWWRRDWFRFGENHRDDGTTMSRELTYDYWFLELDSMVELQGFIIRQGNIVIQEDYNMPGILLITIYDDYLE